MKLLADAMLGRLARWLRFLGYDTAYLADTDDFAVLRLARTEERFILTRDHDLAERWGGQTLLIASESLEDQLRQVWANVGPPSDTAPPRCSVCNQPLTEATPEEVAGRVPAYVQRTHETFSQCNTCERVYWKGTHWQRMERLIRELRDEAGSDTID